MCGMSDILMNLLFSLRQEKETGYVKVRSLFLYFSMIKKDIGTLTWLLIICTGLNKLCINSVNKSGWDADFRLIENRVSIISRKGMK